MGEFGIQILGDGEVDVAKDGLGVDGEQAVETCMETLSTLGYRKLRAAILAPGAAAPAILEPPTAPVAPVAQLPDEDGEYKCPGCGLTYAEPGVCVGGEYGHAPEPLLPTEAVHLAADPDGSKAAEEAEKTVQAPTGNSFETAESVEWGAPAQPDRRVGAVDRRVTVTPIPAGAKDRRVGLPDRRTAAAAPAGGQPSGSPPPWPT